MATYDVSKTGNKLQGRFKWWGGLARRRRR
jgi:hypothetical protein